MTAVSIKSNGAEVLKSLEEAQARVLDLKEPMSIGAEKLYKLMSDAMRADASPGGSAWLPLKDKSWSARKRLGKNGKAIRGNVSGPLRAGQKRLKPLRGDTGQLWGTTYATANHSEIWFGSKAKSKGGFFYWLSHQFGAKIEGTYSATLKKSWRKGPGLHRMGAGEYGPRQQKSGPSRRIAYNAKNKRSGAWTAVIPARPWMPVTIEGDQLTRMYGGKADKFFEDLFKLITKYITTGKAR